MKSNIISPIYNSTCGMVIPRPAADDNGGLQRARNIAEISFPRDKMR